MRDDWDDGYDEPASGVASRAVTQGFVGTAGSAWGHVETHCPGCLRSPWPDCACCGRIAIVALPDVETHHTLTLCGACWLLVLTVRMRPAPSHDRGRRLSALQLAEISFLRAWARLTWREIGLLVGVSLEGARQAYYRTYSSSRTACTPMLDSTPATTTTPSVVPKTRRRPALSQSVPTPTTKRAHARASATPSKSRKQQSKQTREPRPLSAEVEVKTKPVGEPASVTAVEHPRRAVSGKYNMPTQGRSRTTTSTRRQAAPAQ